MDDENDSRRIEEHEKDWDIISANECGCVAVDGGIHQKGEM